MSVFPEIATKMRRLSEHAYSIQTETIRRKANFDNILVQSNYSLLVNLDKGKRDDDI